MKRGLVVKGLLFSFIFIILFSFFVGAADLSGVQTQVDNAQNTVSNIQNNISNVAQSIEDKKWAFLSEKWNEFFAKSPFFIAINNFMDKYYVNYLVFFLFGMKWEMTFTFWFIFFLWIWFFFAFSEVLRDFSLFNKGTSSIIALSLTIVAAQLTLLRKISDVVFKIFFYRTGVWPWISLGIFILLMILIFAVIKMIGKKIKKSKDKSEEEKAEFNRQIINKTAESIKNANEEVE